MVTVVAYATGIKSLLAANDKIMKPKSLHKEMEIFNKDFCIVIELLY